MTLGKIQVRADTNERPPANSKKRHRMTDLGLAIEADHRFEFIGYDSLDVDLEFTGEPIHHGHDLMGEVYSENKFNVELKECNDYVQSALSPSGHLYQQVLSLREAGQPCMVLVLGGDYQVTKAVKASLYGRYKGDELDYQIESYDDRLRDFEANAIALGAPVFRWETNQFERLLSTAHKALTGGNLYGYGPRPADGEREITALCMAKGIGPKTAAAIYSDYGSIANLCTATMDDLTIFKQDGRKIGQAKAEAICRLLHGGNLPNKNDIHMRAKA